MPDEYGMETRVAPVTGLNGQDGGGSLMQPLNKLTLFDRPDGTPVALYQYRQAEQLTTLDKARLDARIKAGAVTFDTMDKEARASVKRLTALRVDVRAALSAWEHMARVMDDKAGMDSPSTSHVRDLLRGMLELVNRYAPPEAEEPEPSDEAESEEEAGAEAGGGQVAARPAQAQVMTREIALKQLEELSAYFKRTEPHSPLAYTLEEAVRRGRLTWPELLEEVLADKGARDGILTKLGIRPPQAAPPA